MILHASYTDVVGSNCIVLVTLFSTMLIRNDSVAMLQLDVCLSCNRITTMCLCEPETDDEYFTFLCCVSREMKFCFHSACNKTSLLKC